MTASRHSQVDPTSRAPRAARKGPRASLSVVVVSTGDAYALSAAIARLAPKCRELDAELLVIRTTDELSSGALHPNPGLRYISAPADSSHADLRDIGMREASGDIICIRSDHDLDDVRWLAPFRRLAPQGPGAYVGLSAARPAPLGDVAAPVRAES